MKPKKEKEDRKPTKQSREALEKLKNTCIDRLRAVDSDMVNLQNDRAESFNAYLQKPYGNEVDGRSQFVTSDLSDVVESIMPSLMRTFYGSSNVVAILPVGAEDELAANLMEQKVNYDFQNGVNGYKILDTWFRDALYQKLGVVKYYWREDKEYKTKEYEDLTEAEYLNIKQKAADGKFIIDSEEMEQEGETILDGFGEVVTAATVTYCIKGREVTEICGPVVENVPPEEFIFDLKCRDIESCAFVAHKKRVHRSYLAKYNVKDAEITIEGEAFLKNLLYIERFADLGGIRFLYDEKDKDHVYIYECYVNDYREDGTKIPMKIVIMGNKVIDSEENKYGRPPFCTLTPIQVPHRLVGRDMADLVKPIQELHTYYVRYINDNLAFQNNGMRVVDPFKINMDDLLNDNRPGGIVRLKQPGEPSRAIHNITPTPLAPEVYGLMEKMEVMRQERTGVTKYNSGLDSKSLNRTATGISQIMNAAMQRIELIARTFAETGVKDLFQALVDMNLDFFDGEMNIRINKNWQRITPDLISGRFDITVDVGAAMGTAEIQVQQMLQALNTYQMLKQSGTPIPVKYEFNIMREIWTKWGYKNVDMYAPSTETIVRDVLEQQQAMQVVQGMMAQGQPQPEAPPEEAQMPHPAEIEMEAVRRGLINA